MEIQKTFAQIRPQTQKQPEKPKPHHKTVLVEQNIQQILQNQQANFATPYKLDFEHVWQDNHYTTITAQNDAVGLLYLAKAHEKGEGTPINIAKAIEIYEKQLSQIQHQ